MGTPGNEPEGFILLKLLLCNYYIPVKCMYWYDASNVLSLEISVKISNEVY